MKFKQSDFSMALAIVGSVVIMSATVVGAQKQSVEQLQKKWLDPKANNGQTVRGISPTAPHDPRSHSAAEHAAMMADGASEVLAAAPPEEGGQWAYLNPFPDDFNAPHVIVGKGGKVLLVAGSGANPQNGLAGIFKTYLWDPATDVRKEIYTPEDVFCAGHVLMADGRALIVGGSAGYFPYKGAKFMYAFNFVTEQYEKLPDMAKGRWYPSVVTMADGRHVIAAGLDENGLKTNTHEVYDPKTNVVSLLPGTRNFPNYPRMHLARNGKIFFATTKNPGFWEPFTNTFTKTNGVMTNATNALSSCFVGDVRDQNLIVMGGGWPATDMARLVDLDAATPTFTSAPTLIEPKTYMGCVNLPDGTLFEANGGTDNLIAAASSEASILTSAAATSWTPMNPLPEGEHRLYHSFLALLDDGRVLSMTSNPNGGTGDSTSTLVFSPKYLFKGQRPTITSAPTKVKYGLTYSVAATVATGSTLSSFVVTAPPAPTHGQDTGQRSVTLPVVDGKMTMPTEATILPPGMYRFWAVDNLGRPSNARWFQIAP